MCSNNVIQTEQVVIMYLGICVCMYVCIYRCMYSNKLMEQEVMNLKECKGEYVGEYTERKGKGKGCN